MTLKWTLNALSFTLVIGLLAYSDQTMAVAGMAQSENPDLIMMVVGEQKVINAKNVASFSESTRGIIEVKIPKNGQKMILTAARAGKTSLLLIQRDGKQRTIPITVFSQNPASIAAELKSLLKDYPKVQLRQIGPRIFIDGSVTDEFQVERIERVAQLYAGQVATLVSIDPNVIIPRSNIRLDLTFIEMRKHNAWNMGLRWPGQYGGSSGFDFSWDITGGSAAASYNVVNQALPMLQAAAETGMAKIKKRATIITTSGKEASYEAGGEVNIAIAGSQAAELRTVTYGCVLSVLPRLDPDSGLLDLQVAAEVSDLTQTSQDVPGRTLSKVSTLVHLGIGQSIILSGLNADSQTKTKSGLPGLSKIPILGMLFGTHQKREDHVEGLIAITPTVLTNVNKNSARVLKKTLEKFKKFN